MALGKSHGLSATMFSLEAVFSIPLGMLEGDVYYEVIYRLSTIETASVRVIFLHQLDICCLVIWEGSCMGLLPHLCITWLCRKGSLSAVAFDFQEAFFLPGESLMRLVYAFFPVPNGRVKLWN